LKKSAKKKSLRAIIIVVVVIIIIIIIIISSFMLCDWWLSITIFFLINKRSCDKIFLFPYLFIYGQMPKIHNQKKSLKFVKFLFFFSLSKRKPKLGFMLYTLLVWTPCLMHMCVCIWRYILQNYNYKLHFQNRTTH
jgi:hypothetical protein